MYIALLTPPLLTPPTSMQNSSASTTCCTLPLIVQSSSRKESPSRDVRSDRRSEVVYAVCSMYSQRRLSGATATMRKHAMAMAPGLPKSAEGWQGGMACQPHQLGLLSWSLNEASNTRSSADLHRTSSTCVCSPALSPPEPSGLERSETSCVLPAARGRDEEGQWIGPQLTPVTCHINC